MSALKKKKRKSKFDTPPVRKKAKAEKIQEDVTFCICRQPYRKRETMIQCSTCSEWYHLSCIGLKRIPSITVWLCNICEDKLEFPESINIIEKKSKKTENKLECVKPIILKKNKKKKKKSRKIKLESNPFVKKKKKSRKIKLE